jgi:hypothetical protein
VQPCGRGSVGHRGPVELKSASLLFTQPVQSPLCEESQNGTDNNRGYGDPVEPRRVNLLNDLWRGVRVNHAQESTTGLASTVGD